MNMNTRNKGFTLVEIMIALTISVVILGAVITILIQTLWIWRDGTSWMYLTEQTRLVREKMLRGLDGKYGLRQASASNYSVSSSGGQDMLTFGVETNIWPTTSTADDRLYTVLLQTGEQLGVSGTDRPTVLARPDVKAKLLDFTANGRTVSATYRVVVQIGGRSFTNKHSMTTFLVNQ